ncbi:MAG: hypothetical protein WHT06_15865 [Desulfobacterales bacterium]
MSDRKDEAQRGKNKPSGLSGDITKPWMRQFFVCETKMVEERITTRSALLVPVRSEFVEIKKERRR